MQNVISFHVLQIAEVEKWFSNGVEPLQRFSVCFWAIAFVLSRGKGGATICQEGLSTKLPLAPMESEIPLAGQSAVIPPDRQRSRTLAPASQPQKDFKWLSIFFSYPEVALKTRQECK